MTSKTGNASVAQNAHGEWDYTYAETQFGERRAVAIPCQLTFDGDVEQDTERFHKALEERGYGKIDHEPGRKGTKEKPHYEGEICSRENYNRIKVLVFRSNVVRLYPKDDYVPNVSELETVLDALVEGFNAELSHTPIDR